MVFQILHFFYYFINNSTLIMQQIHIFVLHYYKLFPNTMPTKKIKSTVTYMSLPKATCNELRMSIALCGYLSIKASHSKTIKQQFQSLHDFYHRKKKYSPSQIQILVEGQLHYTCFCKKSLCLFSRRR